MLRLTVRTQLATYFFWKLAAAGFIRLTPTGQTEKSSSPAVEFPTASLSILKPVTFTGLTWAIPNRNDGSIERADLDGQNRVTIIGEGKTFTPKQLHLEKKSRKLYWCDREGMRVMRANLDGSSIETLVDSSNGDSRPGPDLTKWCVGITVDPDRGQIYWTQKGPDDAGEGRLFRAKIDIPKGKTAANRTDIEVLFDGLPEPIDLELDLKIVSSTGRTAEIHRAETR